jgi:hypothetical protein
MSLLFSKYRTLDNTSITLYIIFLILAFLGVPSIRFHSTYAALLTHCQVHKFTVGVPIIAMAFSKAMILGPGFRLYHLYERVKRGTADSKLPFQPRLMFASKAGAVPSEVLLIVHSSVGSWPYPH